MPQRPDFSTLTLTERAPGMALVTMSRPDVFNAFDETMIGELDAAFAHLAADPAVRVIVLAGAGKHFSAGADLQWMQRAASATHDWNLADARRFAAMLARIEACPQPTVARIQGAALGGGVGLACACDIAVAAANASFAVSEAKFGILPAVIGPYLVNAVGRRQARRLALTTRRIGAQEALDIGLVQQVVQQVEVQDAGAGDAGNPAEQALDAAVDTLVSELLVGGPQAQREIKQLYARLAPGEVTDAVRELTAQTISRVRGTDEAREGFAAFLDKRPPRWVRP
jgi:methylglutaconyl-CoA hydratase